LCHSRVEELPQVAEGKLLSVPVLVPLRALLQVVRSFVACNPKICFQNLNQMTSFNTIEVFFNKQHNIS
jgi:hypothetical protein